MVGSSNAWQHCRSTPHGGQPDKHGAGITSHLPAFMDAFGDALTSEARRVYERVFDSSLQPWMRLTDPRALTIIHGDAHTWNFLFPRAGDGPAFLIDWQLWHVDLGVRDLAFLMALHWYPSRRRELELPLIRYYYQALLAHEVANYDFDELWLDYRRCVVRNLTFPIIIWNRGNADEVSPLIIEGLALEMLAETSRCQTRAVEPKAPLWLEKAEDMLRAHFAEHLSLSFIGRVIGVHPVHLAREFRRHYHSTVGEYLRGLRIEYITNELATSDASVVEIAAAAGFSDQSHLSRTFKR
jgi:AraC-like DNA-binding protein